MLDALREVHLGWHQQIVLEIASPVDLYFEGEGSNDFRVLRAAKNRFGSVNEVGIFEMTAAGLQPVANPSAAFLSGRDTDTAGSAVTALMEGTRPVLVEIQALAAKTGFATPQRVATGLDHRRLAVLLAVMERRAGLPFHDLDVFLNVAGGMKVAEPAADLAIAGALLSAREDNALPPEAVLFGEISLSGALRPVAQAENRLKEAQKLGFSQAILPEGQKVEGVGSGRGGMGTRRIADLTEFVGEIFGAG